MDDKKWWNNGIISKRSQCSPGKDFTEGRLKFTRKSPTIETRKKVSDSLKGKTPWNKGKRGVYSEDTLHKMKEVKFNFIPWNKGLKTSLEPWNKGLTSYTSEKVFNYSKKQRGQKRTGNYASGENHPNYREDTKEYRRYRKKVDYLSEKTYVKYKQIINPNSYPRTLCGVEGGYQLDHKISVYEGYKNGILPEEVASVDNLQMLPWFENLKKSNK
jgi:hypothetical protein